MIRMMELHGTEMHHCVVCAIRSPTTTALFQMEIISCRVRNWLQSVGQHHGPRHNRNRRHRRCLWQRSPSNHGRHRDFRGKDLRDLMRGAQEDADERIELCLADLSDKARYAYD